MRICKLFVASLGALAGLGTTSVDAASVTSSNFSLGYGKTSSSIAWNDSETSSSNTTVSGDFTLGVSVSSSADYLAGVTFLNRELGETDDAYSSFPAGFEAILTASYSGTPADASGTPDYTLQIVITSISVYAAGGDNDPSQIGFVETTTGNEQSQALQPLAPYANMRKPVNYTKITWSPDGFDSSATTQTRSFGVIQPTSSAFLDGFEVEGHIVVTYNAVPEPVALSLAAPVMLLLARRKRNM